MVTFSPLASLQHANGQKGTSLLCHSFPAWRCLTLEAEKC